MDEFSILVRVYLAKLGVREVELRSGVFEIKSAPLNSLLPYLAYLVDVGSLVMIGTSSIHAVVEKDFENLQVILKPGTDIEIESRAAVLNVLSWLIQDPAEKYSMISFEDEITDLLSDSDQLSVIRAVNDFLMDNYQDRLEMIRLDKDRNLEADNTLDMGIH
jgi:hypothetical protein